MNPESIQLSAITEVAVLQTRTPVHPDGFRQEFPGLGDAFQHRVKVYWLFPESSLPVRWEPFVWQDLCIQPVPFPLVDPGSRSGNWQWIQDPFLVFPGPRPRFVLPAQADFQDQLIVTALARSCGAYVHMARTHFEGGNALSWGECLLLGKDTLLQNTHLADDVWIRRKVIEEDLEPERVAWLGGLRPQPKDPSQPCGIPESYQPFFHLDLFLQPAGINGQGHPRIALGSVEEEFVLGEKSPLLVERISRQLAAVHQQIQEVYGPSVEVIRLPLLLHFAGSQSCVFSPCNALYESTPQADQVLLPDFFIGSTGRFWPFHLRRFQHRVQSIWENEGVRVRWIQNQFFEDVEKCGALHCRVKIIQRQNP